MTKPPAISLIVPTLNPHAYLGGFAKNHRVGLGALLQEVIIAGATGNTGAVAHMPEDMIFSEAEKGRGSQMRKAAEKASADYLLFLHADTELSPEAFSALQTFMEADAAMARIGYFRFRLNDKSEAARRLESNVAWRCRTFALPYGDQGFFLSRDFYQELGGFRPLPIMEDVDLIWRIEGRYGKSRIVPLAADAVTNAEKFMQDGYRWRSTKNLFLLFLFWIKVPAWLLAKLY